MKETAIIICNYNKVEYVLKCIETVFNSEYDDFDLFMVDNGSTDSSVEKVRDTYGEAVKIIANKENLGGSGGFNSGLRAAMEKEYSYVMCLDNDVQVTPKAVGELRNFLQTHPNVGMVGSKVFHLQKPMYVQQMGLNIRFDTFSAETLYADVLDHESIPEVVYCDTVAACSLMMPMKVLREVGVMPEDNFIYWDDMEWGFRVKQKGYQVAAIAASKVYHEMSANVRRETTFSTYYLWRNQLNFFMKYTPEHLRDSMCFTLLRYVFDAIYESMYRDEHNVARTVQYAFFDALMGKRGKAEEGKIQTNDGNNYKMMQLLNKYPRIYVEDEAGIGLKEAIEKIAPQVEFVNERRAKMVWKSCEYIMNLNDVTLDCIYVDSYGNCVANQEDIDLVKNYSYSLQMFLYMHQDAFWTEATKAYSCNMCNR